MSFVGPTGHHSQARRRNQAPAWRPLVIAGAVAFAAGLVFAVWAHEDRQGGGGPAVANAPIHPEPPMVDPATDETDSGPPGAEDGVLETPVSPFELNSPAVARLDAGLLRAVQRAARDAADEGVDLLVTSGWRSPGYQQQLLTEAVLEHGSLAEALRYVATPETSAHVTGNAIDIGPSGASSWLNRNGARYGLCQRYANEPWHFELLTGAGGDCPAPLPDAGPVRRPR